MSAVLPNGATPGGATHLECTGCGAEHPSEQPQRTSPCCELPLFARYDLDAAAERLADPADAPGLWRYAAVLPVRNAAARVSLYEGGTPLLDATRVGRELGVERVWIKDESRNPTGSFKARGLCLAVSRALELGVDEVAIPSAGNAGGATAAYAAAAGLPAHVVVPRDTPAPIVAEIRALGAELELVDGDITDAAAVVSGGCERHGWFDLSTLKEPYRVEGKKTMGYEIFEQLGRLPDVIVYPTGGGTGLIGMWKAFDEMQRMGWIDARRPRMVSVQAEGCAPIVRAWEAGERRAEPWQEPRTFAAGLRVPRAIGDFLILDAIRESGGAAVAVSDDDMERATEQVGRCTGVFAAPEGAATAAALPRLLERGLLQPDEEVILFNTGSGLKYASA